MPDAGGGSGNGIVATTPADGWVISPPSGRTFDRGLFLRLTVDGSGDTFVFLAGDRYPAQRADLGNMSIVLAASDSRMLCIETSRFLQNDGTILVTCTDAGSVISASMCPISG
jgi:hypothetical protein